MGGPGDLLLSGGFWCLGGPGSSQDTSACLFYHYSTLWVLRTRLRAVGTALEPGNTDSDQTQQLWPEAPVNNSGYTCRIRVDPDASVVFSKGFVRGFLWTKSYDREASADWIKEDLQCARDIPLLAP